MTWRLIYRVPAAPILWLLVAWNMRQRRLGRLPDEWYWADVLLYRWGFPYVWLGLDRP